MPDFEQMMQQEPEPMITIACHKAYVTGRVNEFQLQPQLTFTHMPGGWATAFRLLLQCVEMVGREMVKEAQQQRLVEVVPPLPDGSSLMRH